MNGERALVNGHHDSNGIHIAQQSGSAAISKAAPTKMQSNTQRAETKEMNNSLPYLNGVVANPVDSTLEHKMVHGFGQSSPDVLELIDREHYLPMATLVNRSAQACWNGLYALVAQLSSIHVPEQSQDSLKPSSQLIGGKWQNNQTKANLEKKDRILNFANDQKANFIKLLVLLQWSKDVDAVTKTIELNFWLNERRRSYWEATHALAVLKQDATGFQIPNPDLKTAGEVLSLGKTTLMPDIGYRKSSALSPKQIIHTLHELNQSLCVKLALHSDLPPRLRNYRIHDGRATFMVPNEFEIDLSVMDTSPVSVFRVVDFRFTFSPTPSLSENLRLEIERIANSNIDREGLQGCYDFFHELTLTHKLTEFHKQSLSLARNQWTGNLKVELLRRTLVVQYWAERTSKKSWIEISAISGRSASQPGSLSNSYIGLKWMREGKEVTEFEVNLDLVSLSIESVLYQIIAQHSNYYLDGIYDRLLASPLYATSQLWAEQASSILEPEDCVLEVQISRKLNITLRIDPITGLLVISPLHEKSDRLQFELNRSKNFIEDFVPKILNFRCAVVEDEILESISGTNWEHLPAFKPTTTELKQFFGTSMTRINFFRQKYWSKEYLLAITHSSKVDRWWLLRQDLSGNANSFVQSRLINVQPILMSDKLSTMYFEEFAEYTTGMIVIYSNTSQLATLNRQFRIAKISHFAPGKRLPALNFDINDVKATNVKFQYLGTETFSKHATVTIEFQSKSPADVLKRLAESNPDPSVEFLPKTGSIKLNVNALIGVGSIANITDRVTRLSDLMTCISKVQNLSSISLTTLSMSSMTASYHFAGSPEMRFKLHFATTDQRPWIEFLPVDSNPHAFLGRQLSKLLQSKRQSFATNLSNVLSSLTITYPLVVCLHDLQQKLKIASDNPGKATQNSVRLHIMVRKPTMFALQFFSSSNQLPRESLGSETHPHLLARFEIIPHILNRRNMWLLRPAIEEFNKPSYSSQALRAKLREEIFGRKQPRGDWLCLDSAAVCLAHEPQGLIETLREVMTKWAQPVTNPKPSQETKAEPEKTQQTKPTGLTGNKNSNVPARPPQQSQMVNGTNNQPKSKMSVKSNVNSIKKQEVITLD